MHILSQLCKKKGKETLTAIELFFFKDIISSDIRGTRYTVLQYNTPTYRYLNDKYDVLNAARLF